MLQLKTVTSEYDCAHYLVSRAIPARFVDHDARTASMLHSREYTHAHSELRDGAALCVTLCHPAWVVMGPQWCVYAGG